MTEIRPVPEFPMRNAENVPPASLLSEIVETYRDAPDVLSEIFSIFLDEVPAKVEVLEAAVEAGNLAEVRTIAHSLANTTGTLQVQSSLFLARQTEAAARAGDLETISARAAGLIVEVRAIIVEIERFLESGFPDPGQLQS